MARVSGSLALQGVGEDDLAEIVAARPHGVSPLEALRTHYRALLPVHMAAADREALVARIRVIFSSPTLSGAANELLYRQRQALANVLDEEHDEMAALLMAAQITASLLTLQESFFRRLAAGASAERAGQGLNEDIDLAFDLLQHGLDHAKGL